jgi:hypothetical protein
VSSAKKAGEGPNFTFRRETWAGGRKTQIKGHLKQIKGYWGPLKEACFA